MKSRIIIMAFAILSCLFIAKQSEAQSVTLPLLSNQASGVKPLDTISNTATVTMSSGQVKGNPALTTVIAVFGKLTGAPAGTATLFGSINGTDWTKADATTFTVTDVTSQSTSWKLTGSPYLYYRIETVGSGTSTYTVKGSVFTRNPPK